MSDFIIDDDRFRVYLQASPSERRRMKVSDFVTSSPQMVEESVLSFIKNFQNEGSIRIFKEGCCYWFAKILSERFKGAGGKIVLDDIEGHFAFELDGTYYDITGIIEDSGNWKSWDLYRKDEPLYSLVIIRDCILKL